MFRPPNTNFLKQAYIQTIDVQNMKYKQYPIWQTTLTHNLTTNTVAIKG